MGLERLAPNSDDTTPGDRFIVTTEAHELTIEVRRNGPHTAGYFIAFVDAEPSLTETIFFPGEIFVVGDEVRVGEEFALSTLLPLLSQWAFRAIAISSLSASIDEESATTSLQ
jgi:hypothetical protein